VPGAFTKGTNHFAQSGSPADKERAAVALIGGAVVERRRAMIAWVLLYFICTPQAGCTGHFYGAGTGAGTASYRTQDACGADKPFVGNASRSQGRPPTRLRLPSKEIPIVARINFRKVEL
jgi:hypothetical protein